MKTEEDKAGVLKGQAILALLELFSKERLSQQHGQPSIRHFCLFNLAKGGSFFKFIIHNNFSQLFTETGLVEVYLGLCSNTVIAVKALTLVEARLRQHYIVGITL